MTAMENQMSEESNNVSEAVSAPQPEISGEEAVALANEAKATGKSVQELIEARNSQPAKSVINSQGNTEAAQQSMDKAEAREAIRKFKVKVDGVESEVDETELLRGYSHQKAANKILQEGKASRKQATEFLEMMKDPERFWEVAEKLGHSSEALATKRIIRQMEEDAMDPKDKELRDAKKRLAAIDDMEKKQKQQLEDSRMEEMKQKYVKDFEGQFITALQESGLPPTKPMIAEMAKYISRSAKIGFKMSPAEASQLVKEDIQKAQMSLVGNADGETLLKLFGDDVAKKILQARGSKVKQSSFSTPVEQGEKREVSQPNKRMTPKEWAEFKRKK